MSSGEGGDAGGGALGAQADQGAAYRSAGRAAASGSQGGASEAATLPAAGAVAAAGLGAGSGRAPEAAASPGALAAIALGAGLPAGTRPGSYTVRALLGRGGMGQVYLADGPAAAGDGAPRRVALKVLSPDLALRDEGPRRFAKERELLARVDHRNVVKSLGPLELDEALGLRFFAMELVRGKSLSDLVREHGRFPVAEAARAGRELALALAAAHAIGIVHRDVKPSNVLVDLDGRLRLTDFGLARAVDQSQLTRTGAALGTPLYMAPEQAEGAREIGPPADLYALGAVLYELLLGRPPFRAESALALLRLHLEVEPEPPRALRGDVPEELERLVMRLLAKDPARRGTALETATELGRFLGEGLGESGACGPIAGGAAAGVATAGPSAFWAAVTASVRRDSSDEAGGEPLPQRPAEPPGLESPPPAQPAPEPAAPAPRPPEPLEGSDRRAVLSGGRAPAPGRRPAALFAVGLLAITAGLVWWRRGPGAPPAPASRSAPSDGADPAATSPATAPTARAVTVTLADGRVFVGRLERYDRGDLVIRGPDGEVRRFARAELREVDFGLPP